MKISSFTKNHFSFVCKLHFSFSQITSKTKVVCIYYHHHWHDIYYTACLFIEILFRIMIYTHETHKWSHRASSPILHGICWVDGKMYSLKSRRTLTEVGWLIWVVTDCFLKHKTNHNGTYCLKPITNGYKHSCLKRDSDPQTTVLPFGHHPNL